MGFERMRPLRMSLLLGAAWYSAINSASADFGGNFGPLPPTLSWHGIYETSFPSRNVLDTPGNLYVRLPGTSERRLANKCGDFLSSHMFALDNSTLLIAGCFTPCFAWAQACDWSDFTSEPIGGPQPWNAGMTLISKDAGLTWDTLNHNVPELVGTGAFSASIPASGGHEGLHCVMGGFPMRDDVRLQHVRLARDSVVCTHDGVSWYAQAPLPRPRALHNTAVYTLPGETLPRVFVFGGVESESVRGPGLLDLTSDWLLMSDPVDLTRHASTGQALGGWTAVQVPSTFHRRLSPMVGVWPGTIHAYSQGTADYDPSMTVLEHKLAGPGLVLGYGFDCLEGPVACTWRDDWYLLQDPTNMSTWTALPATPLNNGISGDVKPGNILSVVALKGNLQASSIGNLEDGFASVLVAFLPVTTYIMSQNTPSLSPIRSTSASALQMSDSEDREMYVFTASAVTQAVPLLDRQDRPFLVIMFHNAIMRAFTKRCDHMCGPGYYATRCGVDYASPLCVACTVCTGAAPGEPLPTTLAKECSTSPLRRGNYDTKCEECRMCSDDNMTMRACTPTLDTQCGPRPGMPLYLPTSTRMQGLQETSLQAVPIVGGLAAALAIVIGAWGYCLSSSMGGGLVDKLAGGLGGLKGVSNPVVVHGAQRGVGVAGVEALPQAHSTPEAAAYFAARQASILREKRRAAVGWFFSVLVCVGDVTLALLTQVVVSTFAFSLLTPDEPTVRGATTAMHASFYGYGQAILILIALNACVVGGRASWLVHTHRLNLESLQVAHWLEEGWNKGWLTLVALTVPMHSRLLRLLLPTSPLRFPMPTRLHTAVAVLTPCSFLLLDLPLLIVVGGALRASGFPLAVWLEKGYLPSIARVTLAFVVGNMLYSAVRLAWDVAACVRGGGVFRLRRALSALPAWRWLVLLLLPRKTTVTDADVDVVPRLPAEMQGKSAVSMRAGGDEAPGEAVCLPTTTLPTPPLPTPSSQEFISQPLDFATPQLRVGVPVQHVLQWRHMHEESVSSGRVPVNIVTSGVGVGLGSGMGGICVGGVGVGGGSDARRARLGLASATKQALVGAGSSGRSYPGAGSTAADEAVEALVQSVSPLVAYAAAARAAQRATATASAPGSRQGSDASDGASVRTPAVAPYAIAGRVHGRGSVASGDSSAPSPFRTTSRVSSVEGVEDRERVGTASGAAGGPWER